MPPFCTRRWEVEAARDGRLHGKDLDSARRHQATCAECSEEERQLAALGAALVRLPQSVPDALGARRARQRLLSAFNASVIGLVPARRWPLRVGAILAGVALVGLGLWLKSRSMPVSPRLEANVEVEAAPGARWEEHRDPDLDRVRVFEGALSFKVRHHGNQRVLVELPDGELEDLGTVFDVRVSEQQTLRVAVKTGKVSLRIRGQAPFILDAGHAWQPSAPASEASNPPPASPAPTSGVDKTPVCAGTTQHTPTPTVLAPPAHKALVAAPAAAPSGATHPAEAAPVGAAPTEAEDNAYLKIVDSLREHHDAEATELARDYLLRFPNGFRRIEVLNIATRPVNASTPERPF